MRYQGPLPPRVVLPPPTTTNATAAAASSIHIASAGAHQPNGDGGGFGHSHWLPADYGARGQWLQRLVDYVDNNPQPLTPVLREFKGLIEGDSRIFMLFTKMWHEMPTRPGYNNSRVSRQIHDYHHMLTVLNHIFGRAPEWTDPAETVGMVGVPVAGILDYAMSTPSGHAAFLDADVNRMLKKVLNQWGRYLQTPDSARVLDGYGGGGGWFGRVGYQHLMDEANAPLKTNYRFEEMYVCDASAPRYGFRSWDEFFTRRVRDSARPVASPDDDSVVANACESRVYNLTANVQLRDRFWIKGSRYSVLDMLAQDPLAACFAGGTIYQAFLTVLSYHRWHSPVSGTVVRAFVQDGTYFSEPLFEPDGPAAAPGPRGMSAAQGYLSAMATRAVIIIDADNPAIGLVAFIGIGIDEVSTCEITVAEGQHVNKGDQTGMFHFGGSSHVLLFRRGVRLDGFPQLGREHNVPVRSQLAVVTA